MAYAKALCPSITRRDSIQKLVSGTADTSAYITCVIREFDNSRNKDSSLWNLVPNAELIQFFPFVPKDRTIASEIPDVSYVICIQSQQHGRFLMKCFQHQFNGEYLEDTVIPPGCAGSMMMYNRPMLDPFNIKD